MCQEKLDKEKQREINQFYQERFFLLSKTNSSARENNEHSHANRGNVLSTAAKKYYYAPIVLLDHNSANCTINSLSGDAEVKFRIEF